ncbi:MAG: hypothetical protein M3680_24615 [Myxococcota bacterium]|nr:hypothetical protein [Myxococcota bacterium]
MTAHVMQQVRAQNGGIVLFHDIHPFTAAALDGILTALEAEGFTFVRLDDRDAFPRLNGAPVPPPATFIGDRCQTEADCAFIAAGQRGRCHPAKFCTITCAGSCPDRAGKASTFCIADAPASGSVPAGLCVNQSCAALPGTIARTEPRFLGLSTASQATANVCAPRE